MKKNIVSLTVILIIGFIFYGNRDENPNQVIQTEVLGIDIVNTTTTISSTTTSIPIVTTTVPESIEYAFDVIVIGDSLAGWASAVGAAEQGATVALISLDNSPLTIGGQAVEGGVPTWDGHIYRGLDEELRRRVEEQYRNANVALHGCYDSIVPRNSDGAWRPWFTDYTPSSLLENNLHPTEDRGRFCPDPMILNQALFNYIEELNITIVSNPFSPITWINNNTIAFKELNVFYTGKIFIEATETGEMIPEALRHEVPVECHQDVTWVLGMRETGGTGLTLADYASTMIPDEEYLTIFNNGFSSTGEEYQDEYGFRKTWNGLGGEDFLLTYRRTLNLEGDVTVWLNWLNDAETPEASFAKSQQQILYLSRHGYHNWTIVETTEHYQRTSFYRLNGSVHIENAPRGVNSYEDSLGLGTYRADFHGRDGQCNNLEDSEPYGFYDMPAGIHLPVERIPLLVAMPRSSDVSHLVATSNRMQPVEVDTGWKIGLWAGLAVEQNILPHDVLIEDIHLEIINHGGVIDIS